jgi:hypothetical protein
MKRIAAFVILIIALVVASPSKAQTTTATLNGRVTTAGLPLSGALVTISSPALQGTRSAETSEEGTYSFVAVPPGEYRVTFAISGLQTMAKSVVLHVAEAKRVDAQLQPGMSEELTVIPEMLGAVDSVQLSTTFEQSLVNALPMGRGITDITRLAPGVQDSGPNRQLTIHGAPSNENLYMVNGAVITEGLRNQPQNLFIEDAIQETTILSGAVSAEYGRFTGGVVNVITRSGGNEFSGSVRDNIANDDWTAKTPAENELDHLDEVNHDYEATLGGRIIRDRLWFFVAGRSSQRTERRQTALTNHAYTFRAEDSRLEVKGTASLGANQTLIGSYLDVDSTQQNASGLVAELGSLFGLDQPHSLLATNYSAILPRAVVVEAQYTQKSFDLSGGGLDTSRIGGTVIEDLDTGNSFGAPALCGVCGAHSRDNRELAVKATMFHATPRFGSHSLVAGASDFRESGGGDAHQTPSDFTIVTFAEVVNGSVYPVMIPGESTILWQPILTPSVGNAFTTRSAYVNDRVDFGSHWNLSLGIRYDRSTGHDEAGDAQAEGSAWSPRLGVVYDLGGDRRNQFSLSFGRYAAKIDQFVGDQASPGGDPALFEFLYDGPELNTDGTLIPTAEVLRTVFDWFESVGGTANTDFLLGAQSTFSRVIEDPLRAPVMDEVTVGYGRQLGSNGTVRLDLIQRRWHDFYALRVTRDNGTLTDPVGGFVFDRVILENNDAGLHRKYDGAALQGSWRAGALQVGGNYTYSRLRGNVESESPGSGAIALQSPVLYYPEYTGYPAFAEDGWLAADVRHRGNLWVAWQFPNRFANLEATMLQSYHSGRRYSASGQIEVRPFVTNPGYKLPPNFQNYRFSDRGGLQVDAISSTSIGINLSRRIAAVEAFLDTDIINVFNEHGVETPSGINTTVRTNRTDRNLATFNPFTTEPVECPQDVPSASAQCKGIAHYQLHPLFGTPTRKEAYQLPRTFRLSLGIRF